MLEKPNGVKAAKLGEPRVPDEDSEVDGLRSGEGMPKVGECM